MKLPIPYLVAIFSLAIAFLFLDLWLKSKHKNAEYESVIHEKQDSIRYHRNQYNQIVAEKSAAQITSKQFQENYAAETKKLHDQLNVNAKELMAYIDAKFIANGRGTATIIHNHYADSTGKTQDSTSLSVADGYLSFRATIYDSLHSDYRYTYSDSLTWAIHGKKKWLFGNEQLYGSGVLGNPNANITNSRSVLIDNYRDKRWTISAGVSYNPFINQFQPAVHFGYALIKF